MALVFFAAGVAKLRHGGLEWIASDNLSIVLNRAAYHVSDADPIGGLGLAIARHAWLSRSVAAFTVLVELGFATALFSRFARLFFVPAAFGMLIGIRVLMGPTFGGFLILNVFWVPWSVVLDSVAARVRLKSRATAAGATSDISQHCDLRGTSTHMTQLATIRDWEEAEIERSISEARHTPVDRLRMTEWNLGRYLDPPADTPYPLEYAFHAIGNVSGKTVLDYGCGNGENSLPLVARGARVIGLDVSADLLDLARTRLALHGFQDRASFLAASAHDLPLPDNSVDVVLGIAILHHLDLALAAREIRRVLRPGGIAVFQEPVRNSQLLKKIRAMIPYRSEDVSDYERPLTDAELRQFAAPFREFSTRAFSLPFINVAQVVPALNRHILAIYKADGAILKRTRALDAFAGIRVVSMRK